MISVVIPTCHRNDLLAKCLDCLKAGAQTLDASEYEVIVTDDGIRSDAREMIAENFPRARWTRGPRRGPAANRNHGASLACGEWIAFTDDDCLPSPQWLSAYQAGFTPDIDVYEGKTDCLEGLKRPLQEAPINLDGGKLWSCNFLIRKTTFQSLGGFDEDFPFAACEDMEFNFRINRLSCGRKFIAEALVDHPPRRRRLFARSAKVWESRVVLNYKEGKDRSPWQWLPMHLLKIRLREIADLLPSPVCLLMFASLAVELSYVLWHLPGWSTKHFSKLRAFVPDGNQVAAYR